MAELTYREAVARGDRAGDGARRPTVYFLGEDVAAAGGVFKTTEGLLERFGPDRVRDTPITEQAIIGAAMGAAMNGLRPIAELMFSDFFAVCWDLDREPDREDPLHDERAGRAAARDPHRERRRASGSARSTRRASSPGRWRSPA